MILSAVFRRWTNNICKIQSIAMWYFYKSNINYFQIFFVSWIFPICNNYIWVNLNFTNYSFRCIFNEKDIVDIAKLTMETNLNREQDNEKNTINELSHLDDNQLFDQLIDDINGWGWFQKRMWILSLIASVVAACNHLSPIYTAYKPDFRCITSGREMSSLDT